MTAQDFETLRARVQALGELPALLEPFTAVGTRLRLPKEIGDPLCQVVDRLKPMLDSVHYEHVKYDYQTEEAAQLGMSHRNPIRAFSAATEPLAGSCFCSNADYQAGGTLVAMMAAKLHDEDEIDLPLSTAECAAVTVWLSCRSTENGKTIKFGGLTYGEDKTHRPRSIQASGCT